MQGRRRCAACGEAFRPCPRVRDQKYCGKEECRRTRRRRWQRAKRQDDADYRDNQERAQRAWVRENSAYWQTYRSGHPDYVEENRERTKERKRRGATERDRDERTDDGHTREELYSEARRQNIPGRSKMSKRELERALH